MSYSGNMPDWHQYNPPQAGRTNSSSLPQNVNSSHHFISSINQPELDTINLSNDRQTKHQRNEVNYSNRNYPVPSIGQNCPTSSTLTSSSTCQPGVHMSPLSSCVGHYSSTTTMDPRLAPVGLTEPEIPHRTSQMTFPNPPNHGTAATNLSVNPSIHSGITAQTSPVGSMSPNRQPYGTCKGPCCNPDTNLAYQHWEKFGHYQTAPSAFRENLRPPNYPAETQRRYVADIRKECLEKEIGQTPFPVDHRRNYPDYKYRKDIPRPPGYQTSSLLPNYPLQNYNNYPVNYPDYQKCPYPVKEYLRRGNTNVPQHTSQSTSVIKYPEQQNMLVQQKYNSKQLNYQNGNLQTPMPNTSTTNLPSTMQSSYFNSPIPREVQRDFPRDYQDNRIQQPIASSVLHGNYSKMHLYQHKLGMQKFPTENDLKTMMRSNYQGQKYQERMTRYKEILRMQPNFNYHSALQETQKMTPGSLNPQIQPINLQFDQNGVLINPSYNSGHFPGLHNPGNQLSTSENPDNPESSQVNLQNPPDSNLLQQNLFNKHPDQTLNLSRDAENLLHNMRRVNQHYQLPENRREHYENHIVDVDGIDPTCVRTTTSDSLITTIENPSTEERNSREFTDKPQLDVRQFLANWDETEDEEALATAHNAHSEIPLNHHQQVIQNCQQINNPTNSVLNRNSVELENSPNQITSPSTEISEMEKQTSVSPHSKGSTTSEEIDVTGLKTIEELTNAGAIVQCIQTDADDIPTIHIVDHLPNDNELATIQTVYGAVTSLQIEQINTSPIEVNNESPNTSETITLFGQDTGVCSKDAECRTEIEENEREEEEVVASIIESSKESSKSPEISNVSNNVSPSSEEIFEPSKEVSSEISGINVIDESSEKCQQNTGNPDLRKQHSFASEESHNPDDLSLPELPECTPISTTLNTPIHSDSEESSGHAADLAISTNPIEIIQNSPIISFTHSPIKIDPYGNLENERLSEKRPDDSLDFDFSRDTNKNPKTLVNDFEIAGRSSTDEIPVATEQQQNLVTISEHDQEGIDKNEEFYPSSDPLVGMSPSKKVPSKQSSPREMGDNDMIQVDDCQGESLSHRILSNDEIHTGKCSLIDTEDFHETDDLDKFCNISLDSSCMMQLLPEHSQEPRLPPPTLDTKNFTKSMENISNILSTPNLDAQDTSDDEQLDKHDDWIEVGSTDGLEHLNKSANELLYPQEEAQNLSTISCPIGTSFKEPEEINEEKTMENVEKPPENPPYIRSIFDTTSEDSQSTGFDEFNERKETQSGKDRLKSLREFRKVKSHFISRQSKIPEIVSDKKVQILNLDSIDKPVKSPEESGITRIKTRENVPEVVDKILETINLQIEKTVSNIEQPKSMETCKVTQSFRRSHKDTDVEIHVANINMKDNASDEANEEDIGAIEIKINVSRSDKNRRNKLQEKPSLDNLEIIRKHSKFQSEIGRYLPAKIFKRRRISLPNELESKRPRKISDEPRRRKSGGHVYRAYSRKSTEGKIMDDNERTRRPEILNKYPTILPEKIVSRQEPSEVSYSEGPVSSHDDSQNSMRAESPNIYTSQETTEYESAMDESKLKVKSPKRRTSTEKLREIPEEIFQSDKVENIDAKISTNQETMSSFCTENASTFDFDCFDVAPNEDSDTDLLHNDELSMSSKAEEGLRVRRLEDIEKYRNPYAKSTDALEINLNTVPIYTTKDGRITYSPNPRYTYRALIIEARRREGYPHFRDVHFSRNSRDYHPRRFQRRRHDDSPEREEKRQRWNEINSSRTRRRVNDSDWRTNRTEKYDRWREYSDESEAEDIDKLPKYDDNFSLMELGKSHDLQNNLDESRNHNTIILERESAIAREKEFDFFETENHEEENIGNQRLGETKCLESMISHGKELELSSTLNVLPDIYEDFEVIDNYSEVVTEVKESMQTILNLKSHHERITSPDFDSENEIEKRKEKEEDAFESSSVMIHNKSRIIEAVDPILSDEDSKDHTNSTNKNKRVPMKPPANFDTEQDSQMLTDSGLESSTTYTDGSKEHRQIGIWRKNFLSKVEKEIPRVTEITRKNIHDVEEEKLNDNDDDDEKMDFLGGKSIEVETQRIKLSEIDNREKDDKDDKDDVLEVEMTDNVEEIQRRDSDNTEKNSSCQIAMTIANDGKSKTPIDIQKLTQLFLSKTKNFDDIESDILKGLDLALPSKQKVPIKLPGIQVTKVQEESQEKSSNTPEESSVFSRQTSSFLGIRKGIDGIIRRASSDEVPHRESRPIFSDISSASVVTLNKTPRIFGEFLRVNNNTNNSTQEETMSRVGDVELLKLQMEHQFEKPEIPMIPFKSFMQKKNNEIETSERETSTESEVSQFDDNLSSTQFDSEYSASKQDGTNCAGVNFLSTSSQEAVDATDLKQVRKNLALCALDDKTEMTEDPTDEINSKQEMNENREKFLSFPARISSESEDDSNAQDGSPIRKDEVEENKGKLEENGKGKILSFSGRIQSPESNSASQNSPPRTPDINNEEIDRRLSFSGRISSPENLKISEAPNLLQTIAKSPKLLKDNDKNLTFFGRIQGESGCQMKTSPTNFNKVPKFIIKKADCSSRSSSISQIIPSDHSAQRSLDSKASVNQKMTSPLPKIPKMIIRNVRSRPGTPTIEENAVELSFPKTINDGDQKVFEVKIKLDGKSPKKESSENTIKKSIGVIECKIPKMKIKLDERNPKMIFENASLQLTENNSESLSLKNVPKVKIRKIRRSSSREGKRDRDKSESISGKLEKSPNEKEKSRNGNKTTESSSKHIDRDKIPKLKIKKPETRVPSPSPERSKKKRSRSPAENSQKKFRKTSNRHRSSESKTNDSKSMLMDESNASSTQGLSEKIPKVIIKRTSPSAEFKCELSKDGGESIIKNSKWQPEVKLERFEVLDSIAKSPGRIKLPLKMLEAVTRLNVNQQKYSCTRKWRTRSDPVSENDRSLSRGKRRNSDPEQSNSGKTRDKNHRRSSPEKPKSSSVRSVNDDSDDEPILRLSRRDFSRRIRDDTSQDTTVDARSENIPQISEIEEEEESICISTKETSRQTLMTEEITRSGFDFPNASSSHKKPNASILHPLIPLSTNEIANDVVDSKSVEGVNSVIKLESSDESQTTIEILPASSPDVSQPESEAPTPLEGKRRIANGDLAQLYSEDAIPTQFELELEIVDNSSESLDVPELGMNPQLPGDKTETWNYRPSVIYDATNLKNSCATPGPSFIRENLEDDRENLNSEAKSICCSDSLVKEVLAAKETLKRCLTLPKASTSQRTKTAAEKKQGSFVFPGFSGYNEGEEEEEKIDNPPVVFQESSKASREDSQLKNGSSSSYKKHSKSERSSTSADKKEKYRKREGEKEKTSSRTDARRRSSTSSSSSKSSRGSKRPSESSDHGNVSPKKMRPPSTSSKIDSVRSSRDSDESSSRRTTSSKGPKCLKSAEQKKEPCAEREKTKSNEAMPILEPEGTADIEMRESSRSPPVITKQDSNQLNPESPKKVDDKVEEKIENIIGQETDGMTFADIVAQMAYHEKATIKHKRYCILCERWFPTVSRHREHLAGYQHRHTELTQRRTVHALFMLFTGKPCPRLLPASIARTDCAPGEPTPLQIAVQDVAISLEKGIDDRKKLNKKDN